MVTLSANRLKGAITPQILKPGVKIKQEVYMESIQDHISPHIEAAYDNEADRKKWIWQANPPVRWGALLYIGFVRVFGPGDILADPFPRYYTAF